MARWISLMMLLAGVPRCLLLIIILSHRITFRFSIFFMTFANQNKTLELWSNWHLICISFALAQRDLTCRIQHLQHLMLAVFIFVFFRRNRIGKEWLSSVLRSLNTTIRKQASRDLYFRAPHKSSPFILTSLTEDLPEALIKFNLPTLVSFVSLFDFYWVPPIERFGSVLTR